MVMPMIDLDVRHPIWERMFLAAPLVVVGTREPGGDYDLAPKHMATPLGWDNWFCFVCSPRHSTYANAAREGAFTVSVATPDQVLEASLAAGPRRGSEGKPAVALLNTVPATKVDGILLDGSYVHLECEFDRTVDGFGDNSLVIGRVVAAAAAEDALRSPDRDDADLLRASPQLVYLHPGRMGIIAESRSFPFPQGMKR
jgi:flavin reductase (DIM6/NTAB) family NADH-FMN oxidoreductase RutF